MPGKSVPPNPPPPTDSRPSSRGVIAWLVLIAGVLASAWTVRTWLSNYEFWPLFLGQGTWRDIVGVLGGRVGGEPGEPQATIPYLPVAAVVLLGTMTAWGIGLGLIRRAVREEPWPRLMERWNLVVGGLGLLVLAWEVLWTVALILQIPLVRTAVEIVPAYWLAGAMGLIIPGGYLVAGRRSAVDAATTEAAKPDGRWPRVVVIGMGLYLVTFVAMNWGLYWNLRIPHGDSVMYEEHLWNVLHGKGFRSYLDQGLFLGEHIQFVHLFLLPLYVLWPSHLLLELCESAALASGAWFVYRMTRRQTGNATAASLLAVAYLCYFPMQFLDIEIDLKTFRPEAFGIPLLLWALDAADARRWRQFAAAVALCLTVKEDYAIVFAPLGLWIACRRPADGGASPAARWLSRRTIGGVGLAAGSVAYLLLAVKVVIPWFRGGDPVHYARYFQKLGGTPNEILWSFVTRPFTVLGLFFTWKTFNFLLALLFPLGGLPLLSPSRLLVGLPLFILLALNEIAQDTRHHFHGPLVPIVFWAAAAGLPRLAVWLERLPRGLLRSVTLGRRQNAVGLLTLSLCLTTGVFNSLGPLGITFWDPHSDWAWFRLYRMDERARQFANVYPQIPLTSRVASTDYPHARFTHHERSYDYSGYARKVSGYELRVPEDTDYIVIDTRHPYSRMKVPADVPEYRERPDEWELLPARTNGYYIILRRRRLDAPPP